MQCKMCGNTEEFFANGSWGGQVQDTVGPDGEVIHLGGPGSCEVHYKALECCKCGAIDEGTGEEIEGAKEWIRKRLLGERTLKLKDALPNYSKWKKKRDENKTSRNYFKWYYSYIQHLLSHNPHLLEVKVTLNENILERILAH